jgi:hypothetical protein
MHPLAEWIQKNAWLLAVSMAFSLLTVPSILLVLRHSSGHEGLAWSTSFIASAWDARLWPIFNYALPKWSGDVFVWIAFLTAGITYLYQLKSPHPADRRETWCWALIWMILLIFVVPFHSRDLFGYVNRGVQLGLLGVNPYVHPVADMPHWQQHPWLTEHWLNNPSPYGFIFTALCGGLVWGLSTLKLGVGSILLTFKLIMALAHIGVSVLVRRLSPSNQADRNFRLVLWHPLLLLQLIANGHNDGLMAFFLMLAIALTVQTSPLKKIWALPALMTSILIKWLTGVTTPFFLMALWQKQAPIRWARLLAGGALALGVLALSMIPFWPTLIHIQWQAMADNAGMSQHSIQSSLYRLGYYTAHGLFPSVIPWLDTWRQAIKTICMLGYALSLGWIVWQYQRRMRQGDPSALAWAICATLMGLILLASGKFHAWYLAVIIPLALILPRYSQLRRAVLSLSVVQLLAFTPLENAHVINGILLVALPLLWPILKNFWRGRVKISR